MYLRSKLKLFNIISGRLCTNCGTIQIFNGYLVKRSVEKWEWYSTNQSRSVNCKCINMWRKAIRRLFILSQLALAMYYSNNAITSWNDSPIVTSVKMTSIRNVQFPAVTVCYDINEWKWPGIVHAMSKQDTANFAETYYSQDNAFINRVQASDLKFRKSQLYKKAITNTTTIGFIKEILPEDLQPVGLFLHLIYY